MIRFPAARAMLLGSCLTLSACGVSYVSPLVGRGDGVTVVPITGPSVALANAAPYAPRSLPAAFAQTAGAGGTPRGAGALPSAPVVPDLAPGSLELRLPPPATPGPYRIGVGDVVELASRTGPDELDPALTGELAGDQTRQSYTVRDDGAIAVPDVGAVMVGGMTIDEAEQRLFERFVETGIDPDFSLEVAEFNSRTITVGGEVANPAALPVTLNVPTLDQALTQAGGVTASAPEYASIRIYRDGTLYQIPLEDYASRGDLRGVQLMPGDSVFVDTSYDLDRALTYYGQQIELTSARRADRVAALDELRTEIELRRAELAEARSVFQARTDLGAEDRDYVYLAGEVADQGRYPLPYGRQASLADALYESGGFETETGNPSQIYVLRASTDPGAEPVTAWHLDARNAANLVLATRFEMRPDDIVFIEEQPITRWNRAFQQFFPALINTASDAVAN